MRDTGGENVRKILSALLFLFCLFLPLAAGAEGRVLPEDFVVRGVALGEPEDLEQISKAFGKPLFDNEKSMFGIRVKYYTFKKKFSVGVSVSTGKVVDIVIEDKDYAARADVRYGATPHRIAAIYGKKDRVRLNGLTWHIYENPEHPTQRMMLEVEPGTWSLVSWRLTSLPLTEEEADRRIGEEDEDWQNANFDAYILGSREIDMSAIEGRDGDEKGPKPPWKK